MAPKKRRRKRRLFFGARRNYFLTGLVVVSLPSAQPWQSLHWDSLYLGNIFAVAALNFLSLGAPSWQAVHLAPLMVVILAMAAGATSNMRAAVRRVMRRMKAPCSG